VLFSVSGLYAAVCLFWLCRVNHALSWKLMKPHMQVIHPFVTDFRVTVNNMLSLAGVIFYAHILLNVALHRKCLLTPGLKAYERQISVLPAGAGRVM